MNKGTMACLILTKLDYIGEDPISILGHIPRYLELGHESIFFSGNKIQTHKTVKRDRMSIIKGNTKKCTVGVDGSTQAGEESVKQERDDYTQRDMKEK